MLEDMDARAPDLGEEASFLFWRLEIITMHFEADLAGLELKIANLQKETTSTKMKVRAIDCWAAGLKHAAQAPHLGPYVDDDPVQIEVSLGVFLTSRQDWHDEPYPRTAPKCFEIVRIVDSCQKIPADYKLPTEPEYEFYAVVIEELKAQRKVMALDSEPITKKLSDLLDRWNSKSDLRSDDEVINAVAKMKIYTDAWAKTIEEIEGLKVAGSQQLISSKASKASQVNKASQAFKS
ncbi:hypothetical protein CSHISOI_07818 [Colletotrichum shisoi]|uniref:Uncharacterized protein n=1 Tax=Colletotrichum shisoi TaxID=2078593 RepID=A0A5Q4BM19_9PEZI|nr:hypothetical protein CSHISOI_07818 [Colletotrichum shisoi]